MFTARIVLLSSGADKELTRAQHGLWSGEASGFITIIIVVAAAAAIAVVVTVFVIVTVIFIVIVITSIVIKLSLLLVHLLTAQ